MREERFEKFAIKFDEDPRRGIDVYLRWGFLKPPGITTVEEAYVGLEVGLPGHRRFTIVHYDNSHGQEFHRHVPGYPRSGSGKISLSHVEPNTWCAFAKDEAKANWRTWVDACVPLNVEVIDASLEEESEED